MWGKTGMEIMGSVEQYKITIMWTSCGDVTVTVTHYNQRHQNTYPHITLTKHRPLAEHSYTKPRLQMKENKESIWMSGPFVAVL